MPAAVHSMSRWAALVQNRHSEQSSSTYLFLQDDDNEALQGSDDKDNHDDADGDDAADDDGFRFQGSHRPKGSSSSACSWALHHQPKT